MNTAKHARLHILSTLMIFSVFFAIQDGGAQESDPASFDGPVSIYLSGSAAQLPAQSGKIRDAETAILGLLGPAASREVQNNGQDWSRRFASVAWDPSLTPIQRREILASLKFNWGRDIRIELGDLSTRPSNRGADKTPRAAIQRDGALLVPRALQEGRFGEAYDNSAGRSSVVRVAFTAQPPLAG